VKYNESKIMKSNKKDDPTGINTNVSYFTLRKIIGLSGLFLPIGCWMLAWSLEPSISAFYYTRSGVLFTAVLTLCGVFLMTYRGFDDENEKLTDNVITWIGGIAIVLVAAVPTPFAGLERDCPTPICHQSMFYGSIHFGSAVLFFLAMSYLSIVHFTRGIKPFTIEKIRANRVYLICGYGMLATLLFTGVVIGLDELGLVKRPSHLVFWVEFVMLTLFGISWSVKGLRLKNTVEPIDH
jgi:heme A synthase